MKRNIFATHLIVAAAAVIAAQATTGLLFLVLVAAAAVAGALLAWRPVSSTIRRLNTAIRTLSQESVPPGVADAELAETWTALAAVRENYASSLAALTADKHLADLILGNMRDGVLLTDTVGQVLLANTAATKIFQLEPNQFINRPLSYSIHSRDLDRLMQTVIETSREAEAEIEIYVPVERHLQVTTLPIGDETGLSAVLTVFQDVTSRHQVEAVRRDFVANVSHELKTPVAGINLLADSVAHSIGRDERVARRFADKLGHEASLLAQLVSDLLDLSQLEASEIEPIFTGVSVSEIVKKIVAGFTENAASKGLSLQTELAVDLPKIAGNEKQLGLMARNLIDNSIHYTPTGGRVMVTTGIKENMVFAEVSDTGVGIPAGEIDRIFERFYRVDKARSRETGGTGLGLSIVKHVVDKHGGEIQVDSTLGVGSKFTIFLPATDRP